MSDKLKKESLTHCVVYKTQMYDWIFAGEFLFARAQLDGCSEQIDSEMTMIVLHSRPGPPRPRCASSVLRLSCFDLE